MKIVISLMICLLGVSAFAARSGVSTCARDSYSAGRIDEVPSKNRIDVLNARGETIGALVFQGDPRDGRMESLYLCGSNPGYYYVNSNSKDWITRVGQTIQIGSIWNDEYEVEAKARTLSVVGSIAHLQITIQVQSSGSPEDADYLPFAANLHVNLPLK